MNLEMLIILKGVAVERRRTSIIKCNGIVE